MPTPSSGQISFTDIVNEFGQFGGITASISEYGPGPATTTGYGGTTRGIPPVTSPSTQMLPTTDIALSLYRNRTARANPNKIINAMNASFQSYNAGVENFTTGGSHRRYFPFAALFAALDNAGGNQTLDNGATGDGPGTPFNFAGLDEDIVACEANTIVYWVVGRANPVGDFLSCRINQTNTLALSDVTAQNSGTNLADKIYRLSSYDLRSGFLPKGEFNSFFFSVKSSVTVVHETLGDPNSRNGSATTGVPRNLTKITRAALDVPGAWRGCGGGDCDSGVHAGFLVIPNRWVLRSHEMFTAPAPQMTLRPYEIAMVHYAGNNTNLTPPTPTVVTPGGASITRMWSVNLSSRGISCMVLYANNSNTTTTYSFGVNAQTASGFPGRDVTSNSGTGWVPAAYIFSMVGRHLDGTSADASSWSPGGDGWLSSRIIP